MYFIQGQYNKKGRYALIAPGGTITARYLYALCFDSEAEALARLEEFKRLNPQHNFRIIKK